MENLDVIGAIGNSAPFEEFACEEIEGRFDGPAMVRVLTGQLTACHMKNVISQEVCASIAENFWTSAARRPRQDDAPAVVVGGYHFEKTTDEYIEQCAQQRPAVEALFRSTRNPLRDFEASLARSLQRTGAIVRRAQHRGRPAGECRAIAWAAPGPYMLEPHDDLAPLAMARQRGFEVQDVLQHVTMAVNMYISMPHTGGELCLWNLRPDREFRRRYGVEDRGHPYPPSAVEDYPSIVVAVKPGDCLVFNGAFVHAVNSAPSPSGPHDSRLSLTFFVGFKDDRSVLWWT
jgi:Carrier-protein-independent halogenase WelO5